jgi:glycosyltransferase involved in cell wall biosynthesis
MPPTVSAIITTYNYGHFVAGAIESVLQQTRPPDEVVVMDDGSTDGTAEVVAPYRAAGVRYVWQPNAGMSAIRNHGLRETQGDLVTFLDSDDRWLPNKLALQLEHLRRYPQVGLISGGEWQVRAGDTAPPYPIRRTPLGAARLYPRILIENMFGNASLVLIRRACFARVGVFDETVGLGQDWDMWIRLTRVFPIGVVDAPLITYSRHAGSVTAGKVWQRFASNRAFQRRYIRQVPGRWTRWGLERAAQSMNCYYTAAALADDATQRRAALALALAALVLDPLYAPRLKIGLLLRAGLGQAAFARLRRLRRPARRDDAPAL